MTQETSEQIEWLEESGLLDELVDIAQEQVPTLYRIDARKLVEAVAQRLMDEIGGT